MIVAATAHAPFPLGWIADLLAPLTLTVLLYVWSRASRRIGVIETGLATAQQALSLLVAQAADDKILLAQHGTSINALQIQTAILEDRIAHYQARPLPNTGHARRPVPD